MQDIPTENISNKIGQKKCFYFLISMLAKVKNTMRIPKFLSLPESENMHLILNANYVIEYDCDETKSIENVLYAVWGVLD